VEERKRAGAPTPADNIAASPMLAQVLDAIGGGVFSPDDPNRFKPIIDGLRGQDRYMLTDDFDS
jgi:starch phosphorylase